MLESLEEQRQNENAQTDAINNDGNDDENVDEDEDEEGEEEEEIIWSPLALAASRSDLTMFNFLIEKYSSRLPAEEFDSALVKAAQGGRSEAFKLLFRDYRHPHQILQD